MPHKSLVTLKSSNRISLIWVVFLLLLLPVLACSGIFPTPTPSPTYTPLPTYTPYPTYTAWPTATIPTPDPRQGAVAYFPFHRGAMDESGNGVLLTVHGAKLTVDRDGNTGEAYRFDGMGDFIATELHLSPREYETVSMMAWIKPMARFDNWKAVLSADDGGYDRGFGIRTNKYEVQVGDQGWQPGAVIDIGQWQYVGVVYEKGQISFYKNGLQFTYGNGGNFGESAQPMLIGANLACGDCFFNGAIDEVLILGRALSAEEVNQLYQSQQ